MFPEENGIFTQGRAKLSKVKAKIEIVADYSNWCATFECLI